MTKINKIDNEFVFKAFEFATEKHKFQVRKVLKEPYIKHIYDVYRILKLNMASQNAIISGLLHDTIEDTETVEKEIEDLFGTEILANVLALTEDKNIKNYKERKQLKIDGTFYSNYDTQLVKCADLLANISDLYMNLLSINSKEEKSTYWKIYNAPKETIKWYYTSMLKNLTKVKHLPAYKELKKMISKVFK